MDFVLDFERLRRQRMERKLTLATLAQLSRVSEKSLTRWETGKKQPHLSSLVPVATALGISDYRELLVASFDARDREGQRRLRRTGPKFRLVVWDLDGTLLVGAGFKFSWQRVWQRLGQEERRRQLMGAYLRGELGSGLAGYSRWCRECLKVFQTHGLTHAILEKLAAEVHRRPGITKVLQKLKSDGVAQAVLSGGLAEFATAHFPEADTMFSHVFANRCRFDTAGHLLDIEPTPYDFERKRDGLQFLARAHGIEQDEVAFVGDAFNDAYVASGSGLPKAAGLTLAFASGDAETRARFDFEIPDHDPSLMLEHLYEND